MALKDKLMTLEDFKAVRDVDVASNSAQFTEIKADLDDLDESLQAITDDFDDIQNLMPTTTASGASVVLDNTNGDVKIKSLLINAAQQYSGSANPVGTITGYDSIELNIGAPDSNTADDTISVNVPNTIGTLYGGDIDLLAGTITQKKGCIDLSELTWTTRATGETAKVLSCNLTQNGISATNRPYWSLRNSWKIEEYANRGGLGSAPSTSSQQGLYQYYKSGTSPDDIRDIYLVLPVSSSPSGVWTFDLVELAYEEHTFTPPEIDLPEEEVKLWTNCGNITDLTYRNGIDLDAVRAYTDVTVSDAVDATEAYARGLAPVFCGTLPSVYEIESVDYTDANTVSGLYALYDALVEAHSSVMSRNLLGYASDANGDADENLPIYEYVISAALDDSSYNWTAKTICLTSLIHGNERIVGVGLYNFIASLFGANNQYGAAILRAFNFRIVPIVNPWAYNNDSRTNARGVNLNRNFGYNWSSNSSSDKGSAAYSELETQAVKTWIDAHAAESLFHLDMHTYNVDGGIAATRMYVSSNCVLHRNTWMAFVRGDWYAYHKTVYGYFVNGNHLVEANNIPSLSAEFYQIKGVDSSIMEMSTGEFSVMCRKTAELMANFALTLIKYYRA